MYVLNRSGPRIDPWVTPINRSKNELYEEFYSYIELPWCNPFQGSWWYDYKKYFQFLFMVSRALPQSYAEFNGLFPDSGP